MSPERNQQQHPQAPQGNPGTPQKDPDDWITGDEAMTKAQASYLATLSAEAGDTFDSGLSKAEASKRIEELKRKTGRGKPQAAGGDGGTSIRANESASGRDETAPPSEKH